MMEMKAQWLAWAQRGRPQPARERVLILLSGHHPAGGGRDLHGWLDAPTPA